MGQASRLLGGVIFQFHKGTIKTLQLEEGRAKYSISIP